MAERIKKSDILSNAKFNVKSILDKMEPIKFVDAELYLINREVLNELMVIDSILLPYKKDTRRCEVYSIDKMVNILNPKFSAFKYVLNPIYRSSQVWDRTKTIDRLDEELAKSKKRLLDLIEEKTNSEELDEFALESFIKDINEKIEQEEQNHHTLKLNPEKEDILITNFEEMKLHGNIRWYYFDENGEKCSSSSHLKTTYPNLLLFDPTPEVIDLKRDVKIEKFIASARRVFGNVYIKERKK